MKTELSLANVDRAPELPDRRYPAMMRRAPERAHENPLLLGPLTWASPKPWRPQL
jgi:hypothetical protein